MSYRIFLAHPKDHPDLEQLRTSLGEVLRARGAVDFTVTGGNEDYERNFTRYGGWSGWTTSVAQGTEYHEGQIAPRFHAFVVGPDKTIGKATSDILCDALAVGKPVWFFNGAMLLGIRGVARINGNFKDGWEIY